MQLISEGAARGTAIIATSVTSVSSHRATTRWVVYVASQIPDPTRGQRDLLYVIWASLRCFAEHILGRRARPCNLGDRQP